MKNGHLPTGSENARGRLSRANIELIEAAVAGGARIEGYGTVTTLSSAPAKVERVAATTAIADIGEPTRPEKYFRAFVGTQEIGTRTVCANEWCRSSLTYCKCDSPQVWVDTDVRAVVTFKPRSNPETFRNRWW